jgi:anaerobic selenocysteine-containing dehydrogenase
VEAPARVTDEIMAGVISLPHGFGHARPGVRQSVATLRPGVSHNDLTLRTRLDVLSGTAALVGTPVRISPAFAVAAEAASG